MISSLFLCAQTRATDLGVNWTILAFVLLGVAALMIVIRGMGMVAAASLSASEANNRAKEAQAQETSAERAVNGAEADITPQLVAVLTAAATAMLGKPVRIDAISVGKMAAQRSWSREGRREIYLSHRIR